MDSGADLDTESISTMGSDIGKRGRSDQNTGYRQLRMLVLILEDTASKLENMVFVNRFL